MSDTLPDRGRLDTEQRNVASAGLDVMSVPDMLGVFVDEDARVLDAVQAAVPSIAKVVEMTAERMRRGGRLIYFGAGTSGRLGVLDASECPPTFHTDPSQVVGVIAGGDAALRKSSEGMEDDPDGVAAEFERLGVGAADVAVGIAAGGTTPYVLGGLALAKRRGAGTALMCCVEIDQPATADVLVKLRVGPEVVTGSTRMKSGTATKLALNMISTGTMVQLGKTWGNLMVDLKATNAKLRDRAARIITSQTDLSRDDALALLDRAGGWVKAALVMQRLGVDRAAALEKLEEHGGRLRPLLGVPR